MADGRERDRVGRPDLHRDRLRAEREQSLEFLGEDVRGLVGALDVPHVRTPGVGHAAKEFLVIVGAKSDGGRGDPGAARVAAEA